MLHSWYVVGYVGLWLVCGSWYASADLLRWPCFALAGVTVCNSGGASCQFAQINLKLQPADTSESNFDRGTADACQATTFRFSFVDPNDSDAAVQLNAFEIAFYDFDNKASPTLNRAVEQFYAKGLASYSLGINGDLTPPSTTICALEPDGDKFGACDNLNMVNNQGNSYPGVPDEDNSPTYTWMQDDTHGPSACTPTGSGTGQLNGETIFKATQTGINTDNPQTITSLSEGQKGRSIILRYANTNSFEVRFEIICRGGNGDTVNCEQGGASDGRNFLFGPVWGQGCMESAEEACADERRSAPAPAPTGSLGCMGC